MSITVTAVNDPPQAVGDAYTVNEGDTLNVAAPGVLANDSDPEGGALTAILVQNVHHGVLTLGADGSFSYAPNTTYHAEDFFTYRARDPEGKKSAIVTVMMTGNYTNDPPTAGPDQYAVAADTLLDVDAPGVLADNYDHEGEPVKAILIAGPSHGVLEVFDDNGHFHYRPAAGFTGVGTRSPIRRSTRAGDVPGDGDDHCSTVKPRRRPADSSSAGKNVSILQLLQRHVLRRAERHDGAEHLAARARRAGCARAAGDRPRASGAGSGSRTDGPAKPRNSSSSASRHRVVLDVGQLTLGSRQQVPRHLVPVDDRRAGCRADETSSAGCSAFPPSSDGSTSALSSCRRGGIAHQHVRVAIEHDRAVRLVAVENELQDAAHVPHLLGRERRLPVDVRVATGFEQPVALAERHVERLGKHQQRLPAWLRAPGLDEAHVARREARAQGEIELAHPARGAPLPQQLAERATRRTRFRVVLSVHATMLAVRRAQAPLPRR